uniref:Uncharacterized protein n=1 Tax=Lepeophtheirus salmonis TaxID=72036 RepID=A0A0K2T1F1_LEPSM
MHTNDYNTLIQNPWFMKCTLTPLNQIQF